MTKSGKVKQSTRKTPLGIERHFDRFGEWLDSSWAAKAVTPMLVRNPGSMKVLTWLMRIVVGATFVVSGLAKGIDPWGTYYKLQEYLAVLHMPLETWGNTVLAMSFFLFSLEFITGVSLLLGCFRKAAPIFASLFMIVMLPLTLWIAVADPVADCGCFGDFLVISNWATFLKNVALSLGIVWLLKFNCRVRCLISPYLQWMAAVGMSAYILAVGFIGYRQQPMVDFRQYRIGARLFAAEEGPEYLPSFDFIYEKNGVERRYGEDDSIPDESDGWKFVRREEKGFVANDDHTQDEIPTSDFRIWNEDASEDVTEYIAGGEHQLILFIPDIRDLSMATSWKINRIYDISSSRNIDFLAVASGDPADIEQWRDLSSGQYPIYTAQDTSIKELVRGNPALVGLENGVILWKTALSAIMISDSDDDFKTFPIGVAMSGPDALICFSVLLVGFLAILSLLPAFSHVSPSLRHRSAAV